MAGPGHEGDRVAQWIYETAAADALLTAVIGGPPVPEIHEDVGPHGTYPIVVFQLLSPRDVVTHNSTRIFVDDLWIIKGIGSYPWVDGHEDDLTTIADRLDVLFDRADGGAAGDGVVFTSVRERQVHYPEVDEDGLQFKHRGGEYRISCQIP